MGVAVERDETSGAHGAFCEVVIDVLPRRVAVDLDRDAGLLRRLEHFVPVGRDTRTRSVHSSSRMSQDVNARRPDRSDHASGLIRCRSERRVRRRDDELELTQFGLVHVDRTVGADVGLDPLDQPKAPTMAIVETIDLQVLFEQFRHRHAARDRQSVRVIRDGAVVVAARQARFDDVLERLASVAPHRVHLQIAAIFVASDGAQLWIAQRRNDLRAAQVVSAKLAALLDIARTSTLGNRPLDCRRRSGAEHFEYDARRGRTYLWNLFQRAIGLKKRFDRLVEADDRGGGALVSPFALCGLLHRREIAQEARDDAVRVHA